MTTVYQNFHKFIKITDPSKYDEIKELYAHSIIFGDFANAKYKKICANGIDYDIIDSSYIKSWSDMDISNDTIVNLNGDSYIDVSTIQFLIDEKQAYNSSISVNLNGSNAGTFSTNQSTGSSVNINACTTITLNNSTYNVSSNGNISLGVISDGITPSITPNASNTVNLSNGEYILMPNASTHVYCLDISYGPNDQRNFTTPNLLYGTDAILQAIDAIMNETPTITNE